jgi:hypothetical protein
MKTSFFRMAMAGLLIAGIARCNVSSHTEKASGVNFSGYKSFAWISPNHAKKADRSDNDIIDNNIKNSVSRELSKKGWVETDNNPDVLLDYTIAVKRYVKRETEPVYAYPYASYWYGRRGLYSMWYPSVLLGYRTYNVPFRGGELTINMIDAKTNKLIWQGWAQGEINNTNITTKEATAQVKSIFKKFDYPGQS